VKKSLKAKVIEILESKVLLMGTKMAQVQAGISSAVRAGFALIGIVILFQIVTVVLPLVTTAGDNLSAQGGLFTLFAGGGILFVIIAAVILARVFQDLSGGLGGRR